jgi:ParB-like chromosome segregation protein Spo0J
MLEFHPLAIIFPLIEAAEFEAFVDDVREHGLAEKIVMHEDKILDGRNRYRALAQLGLTNEEVLRSHTEALDQGVDPLAFVISKNLKRRHLDEGQRAMVAARLATLRDGQRQVGQLAHVPTQEQQANSLTSANARSNVPAQC